MIKSIFFDFDGTIADTFAFATKIVKIIERHYNIRIDMSKKDYYRTLTTGELLKEFKIPFFKLPILAVHFRSEMRKNLDNLEIVEGMHSLIVNISQKINLGILTSNSEENVSIFLQKYGLLDKFCCIVSELQIFGKHNSLKKIMRKYDLKKDELIYIGDELRDMEAAQKSGIKGIGVDWGFNAEVLLRKAQPIFIAKNPEELNNFLLTRIIHL